MSGRLRVLFLVEGRDGEPESPAATYRVWALAPHLERAGIECTIRPSCPNKYRNGPGEWPRTARGLTFLPYNLARMIRRRQDLSDAAAFDVVVIQRDLFPIGGPFMELNLARTHPIVVFDIDDAIHLPRPFPFGLLTPGDKIPRIMAEVSEVWAGNAELGVVARRHNERVEIIPTAVDTSRYLPGRRIENDLPVVGWVGQPVNYPEVLAIAGALAEASRRIPFILRIVTRGRPGPAPAGVLTEFREWLCDRDSETINGFDLGIMPLSDTPWNRGKCAFKALTYMACAVPPIVSPVGASAEVVEDGISGFHAELHDAWAGKLSLLLENATLRRDLGEAARRRVEADYSLERVAGQVATRLKYLAGR